MRLTTAQRVLLSMGIVENTGSLASANSALDLSTTVIENRWETTFKRQTRVDFFDTNRADDVVRAECMFIVPESLTVRVSTDGLPLTSHLAGEPLDPSSYTVDYTKGLVSLHTTITVGAGMLSLVYESGFEVLHSDGATAKDVPEWLQSCAVAVAIQLQNTFPSSPANRKDKAIAAVLGEVRGAVSTLLNSRARPRMTVLLPVRGYEYE